MNIALSSYSLRDHVGREIKYWDFPGYARETFGIEAVEIIQRDIAKVDADGLDRLEDGLRAAGVALVSLPIDLGHISRPDAAKREHDLRLIELWLDAAAYLGCPVARVNSRDGDLDLAIESYRRLVEVGQARGVAVVMENHGGLSAHRETARAILAAVPGLGVAPDFGNFRQEERYDVLAEWAPRARIVHAKTFDFAADGRMTAFDFARCVRIVDDAGYDGYYSIEFEGDGDQVDGVRRSLALLTEVAASLTAD